jgi:hypothetical protein
MKVHRCLWLAGGPGREAEKRHIVAPGAHGLEPDRLAERQAIEFGIVIGSPIVTPLAQAGAGPQHLVRLTWYVTDLRAYRERLTPIGAAYREIIGRRFPTMSVIGVSQLVEREALVEIEATAVLPPASSRPA